MKKLFAAIAFFVALTTIISCELKHKDDINMDQIFLTDIYGKWSIGDNYGYKSIEFTTEGYYFMEESGNENKVIWGKYLKTSGKDYQITLKDGTSDTTFGVIDITKYGDDYLHYKLTKEGSTTSYNQRTTLVGDIDELLTENTAMLSSIWRMNEYSYEYSGDVDYFQSKDYEDQGISNQIFSVQKRATDVTHIYFSAAFDDSDQATLVIIDKDGAATSSTWSWLNTKEEEVVTHGWNLEGVSQFELSKLTAQSSALSFEATFEVETVEVIDKTGEHQVDRVANVEEVTPNIYNPYDEDNNLIENYVPYLTETFTMALSRVNKISFE